MANSTGENILIVESDILIRHPLAEYLRECGYKVFEAANGTEARKLLNEGKFKVDILLADVDADNDGSCGLAKWIRSEYPDIEVMQPEPSKKATQKAGDFAKKVRRLQSPMSTN